MDKLMADPHAEYITIFQICSTNKMCLLNPGVGNHPVITYAHLSQVDRVA